MTERPTLLVTAATTAGLGVIALVTGSGVVAALAGLGAIAVASLAVRHPRADPASEEVAGQDAASAAEQPAREVPSIPVATRASVGMLDESSLGPALRSRTAVARRALRPLSLLHIEVLDLDEAGRPVGHSDLVVEILDSTLRESDLCARRHDGVYVFLLEDTGADGAVWTAERLRRRLAASAGERRFCAGIASYPTHALDAEALDGRAAGALASAREWNRDRIEVAPEH